MNFNRSCRTAPENDDTDAQDFIRTSFLGFSLAQLRHDHQTARDGFGAGVIPVTLGHTVPFFANIASDHFAHLTANGVPFAPLEEALTGPAQATGTVVSDRFPVTHQKRAAAAGQPIAQIAPDQADRFATITRMANGRRD